MTGKEHQQQLNAKKRDKRRTIVMWVAVILAMMLFLGRTFYLQVLDSERYVAQAAGVTTITAPIQAARGEILDYYGRPIATNREGYNIVFNYANINKKTINDVIKSLIVVLDKHEWKDDLPLETKKNYSFTKDSETAVKRMLDLLELAHYATSENCFDALVKRYSLEDRTKKEQRQIMGVRYTMERAGFSVSAPFLPRFLLR